jgi:hypothetical protein
MCLANVHALFVPDRDLADDPWFFFDLIGEVVSSAEIDWLRGKLSTYTLSSRLPTDPPAKQQLLKASSFRQEYNSRNSNSSSSSGGSSSSSSSCSSSSSGGRCDFGTLETSDVEEDL